MMYQTIQYEKISFRFFRKLTPTFVTLTLLLNADVARAALMPPGAPLAIVLDEEGNGIIGTRVTFPGGTDIEAFGIPATLDPNQPPSTPGLVYHFEQLLISATPGDVVLMEPTGQSDIIRFQGDGTVVFYSNREPADGVLADNSRFPTFLQTNVVFLPEIYPGPDLGARYVAAPGGPGFSPYLNGIPYYFVSDKPWPAGSVPEDPAAFAAPEPSMALLFGIGLCGLIAYGRRR